MERRRDVDVEYKRRAIAFLERSVGEGRPFYLYFNHSLLHVPTIPRAEFQGATGNGDWADCLAELDHDFGDLLDALDELGVADDTIVVFAGDNGAENLLIARGSAGVFDGLVLHVLRGRAAHAVPDQMARRDRPGPGVERDRPSDGHVHDAARMGRMSHPGRPRDRRRRPASLLRGLAGDLEPRGLPRLGHATCSTPSNGRTSRSRTCDTGTRTRPPQVMATPVDHQPADRPEGTRELAGACRRTTGCTRMPGAFARRTREASGASR